MVMGEQKLNEIEQTNKGVSQQNRLCNELNVEKSTVINWWQN